MLLAAHEREWMGCLFVCLFWLWCMNHRLGITWEPEQKPWWRAYKACSCRGKKITSARLKCICDVLCCEKWSFINLRVMVLTQELPPSISHFPHPDVPSLFFFIFPIPLTFFHPEYHVYVCVGGECVWILSFHISHFCALLDQQAVQWSRVLSLPRQSKPLCNRSDL